jgi:hypothetical protein
MTISGLDGAARAASQLTAQQRARLLAIADILVPAEGEILSASSTRDFGTWLDRALAARSEVVTWLGSILDGLDPGDLEQALRRMDRERPGDLRLLAQVAAGAYFMMPPVLDRIGYPGQHRDPAGLTDAADELGTGILDPVVNRGPMWRHPPLDT